MGNPIISCGSYRTGYIDLKKNHSYKMFHKKNYSYHFRPKKRTNFWCLVIGTRVLVGLLRHQSGRFTANLVRGEFFGTNVL